MERSVPSDAQLLQGIHKGLVGTDLVLFIFSFPEPASAKPYIPVAQLPVDKIFDCPPAWVGS